MENLTFQMNCTCGCTSWKRRQIDIDLKLGVYEGSIYCINCEREYNYASDEVKIIDLTPKQLQLL